jgi:hypothetical protein
MNIDYIRLIRTRPRAVSGSSGKGRPTVKLFRPVPDGFWVEGHLTKPIQIGQAFEVECTCYQGKICICGRIFTTTEVISIYGDSVFTLDSQYKVLRVPRFDPLGSLRAWQ